MERRSSAQRGDVSESKSDDTKEHFRTSIFLFTTTFFDELKSTNNLLKLVNPADLETLCEATHDSLIRELNRIAREAISTGTNCIVEQNIVERNTEYLLVDRKLSPSTKTSNRANSETVIHDLESKKSAKGKGKFTKTGQVNLDVKPSTSTKSLNKSTNSIDRNKSNLKTGVTCEVEPTSVPGDVTVESTLNTKKKESPHRQTRSAIKKALFLRELETARTDFPINNLDWYYKDQQTFQNKTTDALKCFAIWKETRREGNYKIYYTYMLFDLRILKDVTNITMDNFINALFYIGKGTGKRAFHHTKKSKNSPTEKKIYMRISTIWDSGKPIRVLFGKEKIKAEEAYTREAAMIDVIGLERLCNMQRSTYYDEIANWDARNCCQLGVTLLVEALEIFKRNDERYIEDVYRDEKPPVVKIEDEDEQY